MPPRQDTTWSSRVGGLLAAAVIVVGLYFGRDVLMPIALAVLVGFLLLPIVTRIERLSVGRVAAVVATMVVAGAVFAGVGWLVAYQFSELGRDLPTYKRSLLKKAGAIRSSTEVVQSVTETIEDIDEELKAEDKKQTAKDAEKENEKDDRDVDDSNAGSSESEAPATSVVVDAPSREATSQGDRSTAAVSNEPKNEPTWWQKVVAPFGGQAERPQPVEVKVSAPSKSTLAQAKEWLGPVLAPILTTGLVIVLVAFFLIEREDLRNRVVELFGVSNLPATTEAIRDAEARMTRYLRAQFMLNAGMGCTVGLAMWGFGLPAPLLWGVLAMLLRFVPYIGPTIAVALPVLLSLAVFDGWARPIGVFSFFLVAELLSNNVLEPLAYGNSIGISQTGVIVSAIFWTWLWGPVGLVLAMPMTVCLVIMGRYVPQMRFITVLLRDRSALSVEDRMYQRLLAYDDREAGRIAAEHVDRDALEQSLDETMIGTLCLVERDRQAGVIDEDRCEFVCRSVRELTVDLLADSDAVGQRGETVSASVLCVPVGDVVDESANDILVRLLRQSGVPAESVGLGRLPAEIGDAVEQVNAGVVVLSVMPPVSVNEGRYLCRSLRERFGNLPIVVGVWRGDATGPLADRFRSDGCTSVVNGLGAAVSRIRQYAWTAKRPSDGRRAHRNDARISCADGIGDAAGDGRETPTNTLLT